ncbi:MAG: extracellular solute-binding protein [Rhodoferax sp.]
MKRRQLLGVACGVAFPTFPFIATGAENTVHKLRGTKINICVPIHPHYNAAVQLLPSFTERYGIQVGLEQVPLAELKKKQMAAMEKAQSDVDLISYVGMWKGEYVKKGLIREISPFLQDQALADPDYHIKDISPDYLETIGLVGGWRGYLQGPNAKLYGLPYGAETSIFAYRSDIFSKHDLSPPATYYELEYLLKAVRQKTGLGSLCTRSQMGHQCVHAWLLHFNPMGGKVFDARWRPIFNDRPGERALGFLRQVVETGPRGGGGFGQAEMLQSFLEGESAMYLDSTIVFGAIRDRKRSRVAGKVAFARHPKASKHASQSGGLGLAIPSRSANPEAAFLLMQWLTSSAQDKAVCRLGGLPARMSTLHDEELARQFPEYLTLRSQLRDVDPDWRPVIPEWDEINTKVLGVAIDSVLRGLQTPAKALGAATQEVEAIMRRSGYMGRN